MHGNDFAMWLILTTQGWVTLGVCFLVVVLYIYILYKSLRNKK